MSLREWKDKVVSRQVAEKNNFVISKTKLLLLIIVLLVLGIGIISGILLLNFQNNPLDNISDPTQAYIPNSDSQGVSISNTSSENISNESQPSSDDNNNGDISMPEGTYQGGQYMSDYSTDDANANPSDNNRISDYTETEFNSADTDNNGYIDAIELSKYTGESYDYCSVIVRQYGSSYQGLKIYDFQKLIV